MDDDGQAVDVSAPPELPDQELTALADLADLVTEALLRAGEQLDSRISAPQLRLLGVVARLGSSNLTAVAAEIGGALPSVSRLVDRLVASGLLSRRPSERNRREVDLAVTRAGQAALATWDDARGTELAASVRRLSDSRRALVARAVIDGSPMGGGPPPVPAPGPTPESAAESAAGRLVAALIAAEPDTLAEVFASQVAAVTGAGEVVVWLTDFRLATLVPVAHAGGGRSPDVISVDGPGPIARCLREQLPADRAGRPATIDVPITLKGERAGVLSLSGLPGDTGRLVPVAAALAQAFALAVPGLTRGSDHLAGLRRSREFTVSAEMQWQQLGARAITTRHFAIAAQLEPAYAAGSESFDWSCDADRIQLGAFDSAGGRQAAALTTALVLGALRNARRGGYPTHRQAALVDEAVWEAFGGRTSVEALLLDIRLDGSGSSVLLGTGGVQLFRDRGGRVSPIELDAQLPWGMFEDSRYQVQPLDIRPGDRLVVVSDGLAPSSEVPGGPDGNDVPTLVAEYRDLAPAELVRRLLREVPDDPTGDATAVCVDLY